MRRVLMVVALLAVCVPQLATAEPPRAPVESVTVTRAEPTLVKAHEADTVRIAVVAHVRVPDSLYADTTYMIRSVHRAVAAVMLGLNMAGIPWSDAQWRVEHLQATPIEPTGRSSSYRSKPPNYQRLGALARDSGSYARTRLRITRT